MKHIYIMRHGQTLFNQLHRIQGWCDAPLTERGIKQAEIARTFFERENITIESAYSSTSERASDTLELVCDLPYKRVKGLKEWNFGVFEGQSESLNPSLPYGDFFVPFGGEGEKEFQKRIADSVHHIVTTDPNDVILIVSHGAALANFYRYWEHASEVYRDGPIANCAVLHYIHDDDQFILQRIINHDFSTLD